MIPSVKTLEQITHGRDRAKELRKLLESNATVCSILDKASDLITGACGYEHIERGHNANSPAIDYVNMGDPYITTLLYVRGNFRVGCWGDIVERGNYD